MKHIYAFAMVSIIALSCFAKESNQLSTKDRIRIRKRVQVQRTTPDDSQDYSLEKMDVLNSKRRGLILDIRRFIREAKSEDQKMELNLRLGALYMEDYQAQLAQAQQAFERTQQAYLEKKNPKLPAPKFDNSEAMAALDRARAIYKDLTQRYPKHARRDEMYYFLAISSLDKGQIEEGMGYFKRLSDEMPNSRYINDALVQLGDFYFDSNKYVVAETYYDKILARKHAPLIPYATYKKAWCEYNQNRPEKALKLFRWVIDIDESGDEASRTAKLKSEAIRDITLPFVDLKLVDESIVFFRSQGDPYFRRGLEDMASLYLEAGGYDNSIKVNEVLLSLDPNYHKNPTYDHNVIEALKMKHEEGAAINRLFARLPNYLENSNWHEINNTQPKVIQEAATLFEEAAWKLAVQFHSEAQRTKNAELYSWARKVYVKYLEYFANSPRHNKVRFQLAEILYKQSEYVEASNHYYLVYKDPMSGDLRAESIRNALMSLDRQLNIDRKDQGLAEINSKNSKKLSGDEDELGEVTPYSEAEAKFIAIATEYLKVFPKNKDSADVLYELSYLQYSHREFTPAYSNFWILTNEYSHSPTAYSAAHLIMDILNRRKDYEKLTLACKKFLTAPSLSQRDFRNEVADILRHAELKKIQVVENKGDHLAAAHAYIEYTKTYGPQDEDLFEKALYNASVNYTKAQLYLRAVETQERFLRRFPKSALRESLLLQVAKTYELLANFEKSAMYYELFASMFPKHEQAKNAQRLAGLYYWGSGSQSKAEAAIIKYMHYYPEEKKNATRDLLTVYETSGNLEKQLSFYFNARAARGLAASDYVAYSMKIAELSAQKTGRIPPKVMEEALKAVQRLGREMLKSPKGVEAMSKLLFWYAHRRDETFYNIRLALPQRQLEINLQRKLGLLKDIEKEYSRIASLGSPEWGLASMFRTALAYKTVAHDISQAPVPADLPAEQVDQYRKEIERTFVTPFQEKALALVTQCMDKSQEFNLLSAWNAKCYSLAAELQPTRYPLVRTFYLPPLQTALVMPSKTTSRIPIGNVKTYAYPFFSFSFFQAPNERSIASVAPDISLLYGETRGSLDGSAILPQSLNYRVLSDERKEILFQALTSERPSDPKKDTSFSYLNLVRLTNPSRALPMIQEAIQKDPLNSSLHNLLALTYLELGNLPAAKILLLSLTTRGMKNSAIWNNMGVISALEGKEELAIDYFSEASKLEEPVEASNNLGFISLKYRNGFEAKKHFERSLLSTKDEITSQVGYAVALLQNRELEGSKERLIELTRKFRNDPYARLSLAYFLIDVEKEYEIARRVAGEFVEQQGAENDIFFRQLISESKRQLSGGEELPGIGQ